MQKEDGSKCFTSEENAKVFRHHFEKLYNREPVFDASVLETFCTSFLHHFWFFIYLNNIESEPDKPSETEVLFVRPSKMYQNPSTYDATKGVQLTSQTPMVTTVISLLLTNSAI